MRTGGHLLSKDLREEAAVSPFPEVRALAELKGRLPNTAAKSTEVAGGLAYAFTERSVAISIPGFAETFSSEKSRLGWTLGFGTEWQFAPSWSFKSEVLFARFQREDSTFTCTIFCGGLPARFEHESSAWVARVGVNYRFGGGARVY